VDDDALKIFDRQVDVVEPDRDRSIGVAFVVTTAAAVVLGLGFLWLVGQVAPVILVALSPRL
jgi:hypothetical protein